MKPIRKILIPISGLDLQLPFGAMNAIWQFLKGMYEIGIEPIVVPYAGDAKNSLWWKTYPNPCSFESKIFLQFFNKFNFMSRSQRSRSEESVVPKIARAIIRPKWMKSLDKILEQEKNIDAVLFWALPLNHITGTASYIKKRYNIPVIYYDADLPFSMPKFGGFTFNHYPNADLSEYDAICGNCDGVLDDLIAMGANEAHAVHFAVDPDLFSPVQVEKQDIDILFSAWGEKDREKWIRNFITIPSTETKYRFIVTGGGFSMDLGKARVVQFQAPPSLRYTIARSKINLSITRQSVTEYDGSNSRPFELGAMECCMISNPFSALEKWFEIGREAFIAHDEKEVRELYDMLVDDHELRKTVGKRARQKVLRNHTFKHRAKELVTIMESFR